MRIDLADHIRLQIAVPPTGLANGIANPDGALGGWGWITPVAAAAIQGRVSVLGEQALRYVPGAAGPHHFFYSEPIAMSAGQYAAAFWRRPQSGYFYRARFEWLDAAGAVLSSSAQTGYLSGIANTSYGPYQAPASTAYVRLRYDLFQNGTGSEAVPGATFWINQVTVAIAATSGALAGLGYLAPGSFIDVLGPTHEISIETSALNIGTLTAEILDADLDPAVADTVRPGKSVRLQALVGGVWENVYVGTTSKGTTAYDKRKSGDLTEKGAVRVTVVASNAIKALANQGEARGVETIADLATILEGKGVPWIVNGDSSQRPTAPIISRNDSASTLDQVAITRDSNLGHAWVDRHNILNVVDPDLIATTVHVALTDDVAGATEDLVYSYVDADVSYSTEGCINEVTVKFLRYDVDQQTTEEVAYGPYRDADSIATYGAYAAEFTYQSVNEDEGAIALYAAEILAANAVPEITANSLTINAQDDLGVQVAATVDLYTPVRVIYADRVDAVVRVSAIKHEITADNEGGRWLTTYGFEPVSSVASPTVTPAPPSNVDARGLLSARYRSTNQALTNNVETTITFDTPDADDGIPYAGGVWTVPKTGRYLVNAALRFVANATGERQLRMTVNGSYVGMCVLPGSGAGATTPTLSKTLRLSAGDVVAVRGIHTAGTNLDIVGGGSRWTTADVTYLGI